MSAVTSAASIATLRDPDGKLVAHQGRLFRVVSAAAAAVRRDLPSNPAVARAMESGALVKTWRLAADGVPTEVASLATAGMQVFEHERVPFVTYPCEWSPLMLCDAGLQTLDMQSLALAQGMILKDAAPTNVLFRGSQPVFVDFLSFTERESGEYLWRARHQFDACFLLPLLLSVEAEVPLAWSLRDFLYGVSHEQAQRMLGLKSWLKPGLIGAVAVPAMLSRRVSAVGATHAARRKLSNDAQALYVLERQTAGLRRKLSGLREKLISGVSRWAAYTQSRAHYSSDELDRKRKFVSEALAAIAPRTVLDLGANTGEFSALAAAHSTVIAVDIDEQSVSGILERARAAKLDIAPLVGNLARPTPAEGWKNAETRSLLDRLTQSADLVLMLALMHHLRITSGVPLVEIVDLLHSLTRRHAVFELVPPTDTMFAAMARGRDALYGDCLPAHAEPLLLGRFTSLKRLELANGRVLHLLERR